MVNEDTILIVTGDQSGTRGGGLKSFQIDELAANMQSFIKQVGHILAQVPEKLGTFSFEELEISAEITAKGSLAILGTGGELGGTGGLRFVFRRSTSTDSDKRNTTIDS